MANQLTMDKALAIHNLRKQGYSERRIARVLGVSGEPSAGISAANLQIGPRRKRVRHPRRQREAKMQTVPRRKRVRLSRSTLMRLPKMPQTVRPAVVAANPFGASLSKSSKPACRPNASTRIWCGNMGSQVNIGPSIVSLRPFTVTASCPSDASKWHRAKSCKLTSAPARRSENLMELSGERMSFVPS